MGFYYFIILFMGIFIIGAGLQFFKQAGLNKKAVFQGTAGLLFIGLAIFLFTPGSSDVMAGILGLNER